MNFWESQKGINTAEGLLQQINRIANAMEKQNELLHQQNELLKSIAMAGKKEEPEHKPAAESFVGESLSSDVLA